MVWNLRTGHTAILSKGTWLVIHIVVSVRMHVRACECACVRVRERVCVCRVRACVCVRERVRVSRAGEGIDSKNQGISERNCVSRRLVSIWYFKSMAADIENGHI